MEDLGRMEGEARDIPEVPRPDAIAGYAEGMGRIIDHLQVMLFRNRLDFIDVTEIAVDMDRHDRRGLLGDEIFDLVRIHRTGQGINIAEHRGEPVSCDRMRCGDKGERGCDHLAGKIQSVERKLEGHMAVGEEIDLFHAEIRLQLLDQRHVFLPHIGKPPGLEDRSDLFHIFLE